MWITQAAMVWQDSWRSTLNLCVFHCMPITLSERMGEKYIHTYIHTQTHTKLSVKGDARPQKREGTVHVLGREVRPPWPEPAKPRGAWPERVKS